MPCRPRRRAGCSAPLAAPRRAAPSPWWRRRASRASHSAWPPPASCSSRATTGRPGSLARQGLFALTYSAPSAPAALAPVSDFFPGRLGRELDHLEVAIGLRVAEAVRLVVEDDL